MIKRAMSSKSKLNPASFPRPPLLEKVPRHLQIKWNGQVIADTTDAYWVLETYHPPTYYVPPSSLKVPLSTSPRSSFCEWKGMATYHDIANPANTSEVVKSRIWSYESPTEPFKAIKNYLSFYADPWTCYVDGEKVEPQPGDFYGGWMTSDIERNSVKGRPGTMGW